MKKQCILSLLVGIGLGMILTGFFYEWMGIGAKATPVEEVLLQEDPTADLETALGNLKQGLYNQPKNETAPAPQREEPEEKDESISPEDEILGEESPEAGIEVLIPSGMVSHDIGELLLEAGVIEELEPFIDEVYRRGLSKGLLAGRAFFPEDSTVEEVVRILSSRRDVRGSE